MNHEMIDMIMNLCYHMEIHEQVMTSLLTEGGQSALQEDEDVNLILCQFRPLRYHPLSFQNIPF